MFLCWRNKGLSCVLLLGILALAALLRLSAMSAEFWLDEVWSWEFARAAASPWQIIAGAGQHHDNNHKLNTLFLWFYPVGADWWLYRLHSFVAGVATVAAAALLARRRGRAEAIFAALLFAVNYWLVLCSAEARGYALIICFALLAFYALQGYLMDGRRRMLVLFWFSVMLGFSAQLTFLHCYLALSVWSVYHGARRLASPWAEIRQLLACHLVPCLFVLALYFVDIRHTQLGGAPPIPAYLALGRLIGLGLGGAPSVAGAIAPIVLAVFAFGFGLRLLAREDHQLWLFFAVAIVGSPLLFLLVTPVYVYERHILLSLVFLLLLLSYVLGSLWRSSSWGALAAVVVTMAVVAGSIVQIVAFARGGRGHFLDALTYIERASPSGQVSVIGDHDFRIRKLFRFYVPYLRAGERLSYHEQEALPARGGDWLLVHRLDDRYPLHPRMYDADGNAYEHVQDFPAATFGGWSWHVYRNALTMPQARSASDGFVQPVAGAPGLSLDTNSVGARSPDHPLGHGLLTVPPLRRRSPAVPRWGTVSDRAPVATVGLPQFVETCGQQTGTVRRPCQNRGVTVRRPCQNSGAGVRGRGETN